MALAELSIKGAEDESGTRKIDKFLRDIEARNSVIRSTLLVQYQELDVAPPTEEFPRSWPPSLRIAMTQYDRVINKADVLKRVNATASRPTNILVTKDPLGIVGWAKLEDYFL